MNRTRAVVTAAVLAAAVSLVGTAGARGADANGLAVTVDRTSISTKLGRKFSFTSTISNSRPVPVGGLIAHLNVLSLRDGVYVDPEDWSSQRTRYLAPIPAGSATTVTWKLEAVNAGSFGVYIAVLPEEGAAGSPTTGPAIHVAVTQRKTLNSGGILPLALGIPGLIGLVWAVVRIRRSRAQARGA